MGKGQGYALKPDLFVILKTDKQLRTAWVSFLEQRWVCICWRPSMCSTEKIKKGKEQGATHNEKQKNTSL
jgi:hypothetical protein